MNVLGTVTHSFTDSFNKYSLCDFHMEGTWNIAEWGHGICNYIPVLQVLPSRLQGITAYCIGKAENLLLEEDEKEGPHWSPSCTCPLSLSQHLGVEQAQPCLPFIMQTQDGPFQMLKENHIKYTRFHWDLGSLVIPNSGTQFMPFS